MAEPRNEPLFDSTDDALLATVLRKFVNMLDEGYVNFGYRQEQAFITLDATMPLTEDELAAIVRAESADGE